MIDFPALAEIVTKSPSRIVMLVADGLGGLPHPDTRKSELETASTPNLDRLAGYERVRADDAGAAGRRAGERAGAPGPLRVRPGEVPDRARRAGGAGHRRARRARRGRGARQLLHRRRRRRHRRPARGADLVRGERAARRDARHHRRARCQGVGVPGQGLPVRAEADGRGPERPGDGDRPAAHGREAAGRRGAGRRRPRRRPTRSTPSSARRAACWRSSPRRTC